MTLRSLSIAFFSICVASTVTTSFRTSTLIGRKVRVPISIIRPTTTGAAYGKGADIWPENNEGAILISSSFPNGIISDNTIQNESTPQLRIKSGKLYKFEHSFLGSSLDKGNDNDKED